MANIIFENSTYYALLNSEKTLYQNIKKKCMYIAITKRQIDYWM